ncbi:hypothetical protein Swit_5210 (plasmid) [Rhizorhabdus wittichii RW1]|uniref:Uncharacterized protein n=1 Tax=Rhizorhabdus wittichii (strain DSM 6014 / CCUG 31198 / JCM 15750 / NBRC 105917 / EY 4224 / RW1) TaxID=392499 RepID=A0A9J9HGM3_RHIWR|nr:hypothetical protein Swit_5210 [Rhizorhabdus wittichii RW1]
MVGRVFAERHGLAVERHREIGERHTGVEGDVERARFIVAERPNVAVDKAEAIRARGERSFGPSQACRQDLGRDTAIVRTKARLVGLGPVRTKPPAIAVGMKPAQAQIFGAVAQRSSGAAKLAAQRGETRTVDVGLAQQGVFFRRPGPAPAAAIAQLADGEAEAADRALGKAFLAEHPDDRRVAMTRFGQVESPRRFRLRPVRRMVRMHDAESSGPAG